MLACNVKGPVARSKVVALAAMLAACAGNIENDGGARRPDEPGRDDRHAPMPPEPDLAEDGAVLRFGCDAKARGAVRAMRRLGERQYRNTLRDLLTEVLAGDHAAVNEIMKAAEPALARWPQDERKTIAGDAKPSYSRLDQVVAQEHIESAYGVATTVGRTLSERIRLEKVVGACAVDGQADNDGACLDAFTARFGTLVMRRPLTSDEQEFYKTRFYGANASANPDAYADLIAALLLSPQFLYHVEHGEAAIEGFSETFRVSPFELANRLSYHFWDTMPDAELRGLAESGALLEPEVYAAEVDRLLSSDRALVTIDEFYREWLKLPDVPEVDALIFDPTFKAFADGKLPSSMLREMMVDEVLSLTRHHTVGIDGSLADLFTTELSFARSKELADLYGVEPWDGQGEPPRLPAGERPGLLTRAALHVTGNAQTRPVLKGVFVRDTILCDELPNPPPDVMAVEPELSPELSTRQVVEGITEQPGSGCVGCHGTYLNPIGFATENIDSLGRLRGEQRLFDEGGAEVGRVPIDTQSIPQVVLGDMTPAAGPAELMQQIVNSGKAHACLARQMYRFTFAAAEDEALDGCALESIRRALDKGGSLRGLFREAALTGAFQRLVID